MAQITYTNKVALNENPEVADINKVKATDMNEIKNVVNANQEDVGDIADLETEDMSSIVNAINEVNALAKAKILWTNPSPTAEMSSGTTITLSSNDYDMLIWNFDLNVGASPHYFASTICLKGQNARLIGVAQSNNIYRNMIRVSDTEYTAQAGQFDTEEQARRAVPLYVIGYKTTV